MTMIGESDIDDGIDGGLFHFLRKNVEYVGDTTETSTYWTVVEIIGHPIQIQHWLRVLPKYHLELGATANFLYAEYSGTDKTVSINLTTGQPATEVDYQAIADILNIEV